MKNHIIYLLLFFPVYLTCQNNKLQLKIYTVSNDVYWVDAAKKDSNFLYRNYFFKYKVINKTRDTIYFNSLCYSAFTTKLTKKGEEVLYLYGFYNLVIDDKRFWNKDGNYCNLGYNFDIYKQLSHKDLYSQIKKIAPNDSIDENIKAYCCPECDILNDVVFRKDYKINEKYIKAQLFYNSKKKLYNYPKGKKYWKGKLESNILYF